MSKQFEPRALVVDEPWITKILAGQKTWEMRKTQTHWRGTIGLIRKSSLHVVGTAEIVNSLPPLSPSQFRANAERHGIVERQAQQWSIENGYLVAWVLRNARPLPTPVRYHHPVGAQSWIKLDRNAARRIYDQGVDLSLSRATRPSASP